MEVGWKSSQKSLSFIGSKTFARFVREEITGAWRTWMLVNFISLSFIVQFCNPEYCWITPLCPHWLIFPTRMSPKTSYLSKNLLHTTHDTQHVWFTLGLNCVYRHWTTLGFPWWWLKSNSHKRSWTWFRSTFKCNYDENEAQQGSKCTNVQFKQSKYWICESTLRYHSAVLKCNSHLCVWANQTIEWTVGCTTWWGLASCTCRGHPEASRNTPQRYWVICQKASPTSATLSPR